MKGPGHSWRRLGVEFGVRFAAFLVASILSAQTLTFDAASIRKRAPTPGEERRGPRIVPSPGGVLARASLRDCVQWAWNLREYQLVGPDWITFEQFEIATRTTSPTAPQDLRAMMQTLLAERFQLVLRRERKEMPVLALVPARGQLKLVQSTKSEQAMSRLPGPGLRLQFHKTSMPQLADFLSTLAAVDRPVQDATGWTGAYDFVLDLRDAIGPWANDAERQAAPSVSTVLQEQLGVRLDGRRSAIDVHIVQRAERPSEN